MKGGYDRKDKERRVDEHFQANPRSSLRKSSQTLGIPRETVRRLLKKKLKLKPYKFQRLHKLKASDPGKRVAFARLMKDLDEDTTKRIFFSDESTFCLNGKVNTQNARIWGTERPNEASYELERNSPKLNVFCAMNGSEVIGPYFFSRDTVNGDDYVNMLRNWLVPRLSDSETAIFQQDGAPPHWSLNTRGFLNETFPNRWIGRASDADNCLMKWPPRSPDLTPLDFFLWGYVKDFVFTYPFPQTLEEMRNKIIQATRQISQELLEEVHSSLRRKLDLVIKKKGLQIEKR